MRLRGVRILVREGTLTCRTHTTRHELSAIAPNVQGVQVFASLGFADTLRHQPRHRCCRAAAGGTCADRAGRSGQAVLEG